MFGQSRPVVLDRYGTRGSRWRIPRWLAWLLVGLGLGAAGVVYVQERHLPPRLSASDASALRAAFEQADADRKRLGAELASTTKRLEAANAEGKRLSTELAGARSTADRLRETATALVAALPPDPRGGAVEIRAARFSSESGSLVYDVVLTRDRAGAKALNGMLQLTVTGAPGSGGERSLTLKPIAVAVGPFESLRGSVTLPEGFKPRETTVSVLDGGGKLLGRRVIYVK